MEWMVPVKPWVGLGNPCSEDDRIFFAAATTVTVGDSARALFWDSPWLEGIRPKDHAPLIYQISKKKNWSVKKALLNNQWANHINIHQGITVEHIQEFVFLWEKLSHVQLTFGTQDSIIWKFTANGQYSSSSAYKAQFANLTTTNLETIVWKR